MDGQMESLLLYFFNKKMLLKASSAKVFLGLGTRSAKKTPRAGAGELSGDPGPSPLLRPPSCQ